MTSCAGGSFTVTGEANGVNAGDSVMVYPYYNKGEQLAGAVVAEDGTFTLKGKVKEPIVGALVLNGTGLIAQIFVEQGTTTVAPDAMGIAQVSGTRYNDAMQKYSNEMMVLETKFSSVDMAELTAEEIKAEQDAIYQEYVEFIGSTIDANLDNIFGAYLFASEELNQLTTVEAKERFNSFDKKLLEQEFMVEVGAGIDATLRTEVGQPYIDITLATAEGEQVSISELLADGKYILLDFWATWCSPCVAEMPHLKEAYAEFKDKGFEIYGVSLDRNVDDWKSMISKGDMPWVNVMDTSEVGASESYSIRTIPTNFLISPEGIIVAKNLRGEEVATILGAHVK